MKPITLGSGPSQQRFIHDANATKLVARCFGEAIVRAVYVENAAFARAITRDKKHGSLDWSGLHLIVEFLGGNRVHMSNSEWAHFRALEPS